MTSPTSDIVARLIDWLQKRGEPDSGIRYEGPYSGDGVRRQARVELHGEDATFVASHFHGSGATQLAALISSLVAERDAALEAEDEAKDSFWAIYPDWVNIKGHGISTEAARTALADRALTAERLLAEATEALNWALGCGDDFRGRADGEGAYWWRKELAERAGLTYDRDTGMYVATLSIGGGNG